MAKPSKGSQVSEAEALEIIELASADLETLARAFDLISEVIDSELTDRPEQQEAVLH